MCECDGDIICVGHGLPSGQSLLDSVHMTYKLYIRDLKCICCMKNNDNGLVSPCFEYVSNNANSIFGKYNMNFYPFLFYVHCT